MRITDHFRDRVEERATNLNPSYGYGKIASAHKTAEVAYARPQDGGKIIIVANLDGVTFGIVTDAKRSVAISYLTAAMVKRDLAKGFKQTVL